MYAIEPGHLILCFLFFSFVSLIASMQISQKSLEVSLVLWRCFMVLFLEFCVANVGFAVLAPVFRLLMIQVNDSQD